MMAEPNMKIQKRKHPSGILVLHKALDLIEATCAALLVAATDARPAARIDAGNPAAVPAPTGAA